MRLLISLFLMFLMFTSDVVASVDYEWKLMPGFSSVVLDRNNKIIGYFYTKRFRLFTPIDAVKKELLLAIIAVEDDRFFEHRGVDPIGLIRAAIVDIEKGKIIQGGSTITQQLARLIFLSPERTFKRKFKELAIARELERKLTKREILELYINYVYFGNGAYGVRAASMVLFGKEPGELSLSQCALLAGLIRGPEYYNPFKHPDRAIVRRNFVLYRMFSDGFINNQEYESARKEPLGILDKPAYPRTAGYDLDFIKFELRKFFPADRLYTGGLTIKTTIDSSLQRYAQRVLARYNLSYRQKFGIEDLECAGMAVDRKGEVLFVVGGDNYTATQLNRAFQVLRPIGSTAKPFTYLAAFSKGVSPDDYVSNVPFEMPIKDGQDSDNKTWVPENYSGRYSDCVKVSDALRFSINVATLRLAMEYPGTVRKVLRKFRLIGSYFDLSYVLGSFPSNLYRIVRAYSAIENGGIMYEPYVIREVLDVKERVLYRGTPSFRRVADKKYVAVLRSILQSVIRSGTARRISYLTLRFDVAGKTGTTNDWKDVYFTGFTTSFTMSVWFGRDSYQTMWEGATGGGVASPPWAEIASRVCERYGCGKFVPSYESIVKMYPEPEGKLCRFRPEDRVLGSFIDGLPYTFELLF